MSKGNTKRASAISKPSDLAGRRVRPQRPDAAAPVSALAQGPKGLSRAIPEPLVAGLRGGEKIKLRKEQIFWDKVAIREGEVGTVLYPSSQAAAWVVHFHRIGPKLRVIPESLLEIIE